MNADSEIGFDERAFRRALGCFATGVAIVTADGEGNGPVGMTISSFNAVSIQPPLVLFSIARTSHSLDAMARASGYAINVLGCEQQQLSDGFARARTDKWALLPQFRAGNGAPLIVGALAYFECTPFAQHDGGDHVIFVARVVRFSEDSGDPLIFYRGAYHRLAITDSNLLAACYW
jgi:flavin reductase (DIM6/NTAB) family NADH-FMN oxidoreductase RutF